MAYCYHYYFNIYYIFILYILKLKYEPKLKKKARFYYLSKKDPERYKAEIKIDKNICPECNSKLVIKYDRFGRFKKCNNPDCEFSCKLKL